MVFRQVSAIEEKEKFCIVKSFQSIFLGIASLCSCDRYEEVTILQKSLADLVLILCWHHDFVIKIGIEQLFEFLKAAFLFQVFLSFFCYFLHNPIGEAVHRLLAATKNIRSIHSNPLQVRLPDIYQERIFLFLFFFCLVRNTPVFKAMAWTHDLPFTDRVIQGRLAAHSPFDIARVIVRNQVRLRQNLAQSDIVPVLCQRKIDIQ